MRNSSHGVSVTALHIGFMDTDMVADIDAVKADPAIITGIACTGKRRSDLPRRASGLSWSP